MNFLDCTEPAHAPAILDILNHAIVHTTALYDYQPRTLDNMRAWFEAKRKGGFPVIGAIADDGLLLGFASYGAFRAWPAYKYTVEHSVYVHHAHRGRNIGQQLMHRLIARATEQNYHTLIGVIDAENHGSIRFHQKLGFTHAGAIKQAGFKFNRWLDVAFYQLILPTPQHPKDDA